MDVVVLVTLWTFLVREGMPLLTELLISQENMNWTSAGEYCEERHGRLIVLHSQEKWDYFTSHDQYQENHLYSGTYWIGMKLNDSFKCDTTKNKNPWLYTGWGRWVNNNNEPNRCPFQQCVRLDFNMMRTAFCNRVYKAICEREMVHTAITHDQSTISTELEEVNSVTSSITSSKPEHHTAPTTLLTTASTPEEDVSRSTDSSSMSALSTTVALVTSELENDTCRKCCSSQEVNSRELNKTELEDRIATLRFQLAVNKTRLSVQRRKLISVYDSRPGSVAMGGVACALLVTVIGVIVVPDILALWKFVRNLYLTQQKTLVV